MKKIESEKYMEKIRINAKTIPVFEEFLPKVNNGFKHIEIQLIHSFLTESEYNDTKKAIDELNVDISVVHTPLIKGNKITGDIALNHLVSDEIYNMFEDTCKYAEYISEIENRRIKVVVHNNNSKLDLEETRIIPEKIGPKIKNTLEKYKNVDLAIENSCATDFGRFKTVFDMDDVTFAVKQLNEVITGKKRVYTLLDTCHLMMSYEAWRRMSQEDLLDFDRTFKMATDGEKLGLIHLNNMWDNGLKQDHGRPFYIEHEGDLEKLDKIMKAYQKYTDCEITIEVAEEDYLGTPKNILRTKEALQKLGYELDC